MKVQNDFANRISGLYQAIPGDCLCKRVCWDEIDDSFTAFKKEINRQAHEKDCIYLFRTEMYDYPIPFWVKRNGIWGTWAYREDLCEEQYAEKCINADRCQIRYGVGRIKHSIFMNDEFLEELRYAGTQYIWMTNRRRDAHDLNDMFENADGKLNLAKLFKAQFSREDRLIILDLCDGEFVFDVIEQPYSTQTET